MLKGLEFCANVRVLFPYNMASDKIHITNTRCTMSSVKASFKKPLNRFQISKARRKRTRNSRKASP